MNGNENVFSAHKPKAGEPWDVVIIGSGPAALTASIYTTRGAASTLILGGEVWGGQLMLTTVVDNYPALPGIMGPDLMQKMKDHAVMFGAEFIAQNATSVDFSKLPFKVSATGQDYLANSVILATGSETKWLGIPGEEQFRGRGVSSCAPCDAPFFKDKVVAVVGGGDAAFEETLVLAKYASKVFLIHRKDEFKASGAMQQRLAGNPKVDIFHCSEVLEVKGDKLVESLSMKSWNGSKHFESIKTRITSLYGGITSQDAEFIYWNLPIQGLFVAIGHNPSTEVFKGVIGTDEMGYITKDAASPFKTGTNVEGVFVAGDVHDSHYKQAITAAGFGCMAAMDSLRYLDGLHNLPKEE